ncbi:Scr1 family TA system antitoxin-like transcriptional regulator [Streptomyces xanthochromogenes]
MEFEGQTTVIHDYAAKLVPGILQTEAYAREVLASGARPEERRRA